MALKLKPVIRKVTDLKGGAPVEKKFLAAVPAEATAFDLLTSEVAERSSISSADVKAVIDNINYIVDKELRAGRKVYLGELGHFRASIRSKGIAKTETQSIANVVSNRIIFTPGPMLKSTRKLLTYSINDGTKKTDSGTTDGKTDGKTEDNPSGL